MANGKEKAPLSNMFPSDSSPSNSLKRVTSWPNATSASSSSVSSPQQTSPIGNIYTDFDIPLPGGMLLSSPKATSDPSSSTTGFGEESERDVGEPSEALPLEETFMQEQLTRFERSIDRFESLMQEQSRKFEKSIDRMDKLIGREPLSTTAALTQTDDF